MARNQPIDLDVVLSRIQAQGADALLTRGEAAAIVAARTMDSHDTVRTARNRVAMQMDRSAAVGEDVTAGGLARTKGGRVTADELARWAVGKFAGEFDDLPTKPRLAPAKSLERLRMGGGSCTGHVLPATVEACHSLILQLHNQLAQAFLELARATEERKRKRERAARFKSKNE